MSDLPPSPVPGSLPPAGPPPAPVDPASMTDAELTALLRQSAPSGPPTIGAPDPAGIGTQPRWGMGDILLGILVAAALATIGNFLPVPFLSPAERSLLGEGDAATTPLIVIICGLFGLQFAQGVWPVIVARWKGRGVVRDFGLRFEWRDLGWGALGMVVLLPVAAIMNFAVSNLVGLEPGADESSNTGIITDNLDSPLIWLLILFVVVGAPLVEELFFRGLCLRAIEKRFGSVVAVIGSTLLFVLPHFTGSTWQGTLVLFSVIGSVGTILAILTVRFDRLGPAIVMHFLFNSFGVLGAFFAPDELGVLLPF